MAGGHLIDAALGEWCETMRAFVRKRRPVLREGVKPHDEVLSKELHPAWALLIRRSCESERVPLLQGEMPVSCGKHRL